MRPKLANSICGRILNGIKCPTGYDMCQSGQFVLRKHEGQRAYEFSVVLLYPPNGTGSYKYRTIQQMGTLTITDTSLMYHCHAAYSVPLADPDAFQHMSDWIGKYVRFYLDDSPPKERIKRHHANLRK